jgi:hypothetical protein
LLRRVRIAALLLGLACLGFGATASAGWAQPKLAAPTTGFVQRKGTQLVVGGQPWKFAGYNFPCAQPFQAVTDGSLGYFLDNISINSSANAVRVWFFQSNGGPANWAPFDQVIAALKSRGMRAIPTLTNQWNTCEPTTGSEKTLSWYQTGYKGTGDGYPLSFRDFAQQMATHYANEPTIAFWQLANEPQAQTAVAGGTLTCDATAAQNALRSFADDVTTLMHQADHNHLVDLGGNGGCGMSGSAYSYVHAGAVDLCENHDYGYNAQVLPTNGADLLKDNIDACRLLNKPIFVGEAGIPGNVQPDGSAAPCSPWPTCPTDPLTSQTLQQRANFFQAKIQAANTAGVAGYLIWFKSPYYSSSTDAFAISNGDPTESVLSYALQPTTPPPTAIPETPWAAVLGGSGAGVMGLSLVIIGRRRRRRSAGSTVAGTA